MIDFWYPFYYLFCPILMDEISILFPCELRACCGIVQSMFGVLQVRKSLLKTD